MEPSLVDADKLQRTCLDVLRRWPSAGLAVGVVRDGRLVWFEGFGVEDAESRAAMTRDTVFRVGSMTKPFTAMAVMQLSERGLVDLDARGLGRGVPLLTVIGPALVVVAATLAAGVTLAVVASRIPTLRGRVVALALVGVVLPLAAVARPASSCSTRSTT